VDGTNEKFRMQWEMYEGSISLSQKAVVWKEISTDSKCQITRKSSATAKTSEVVRIRRVWQLESKGYTPLGTYDDEYYDPADPTNRVAASLQLKNQFANMEISIPNKITETSVKNACKDDEWFVGDVVPFENCAYIVQFNTNAAAS
jgi:hypothetical protein